MSTLARRPPFQNPRGSSHGILPFGLDAQKPRHYREMVRIAWENRAHLGYAFRVLRDGVCDGCALGTSGLSDFTIEGTHLCLVRLNLLRLNTLDALDVHALSDVEALRTLRPRELLHLGRIPYPMRRRAGEPGFMRIAWDEALREIGGKLRASDPERIACYLTSRGLTNEVYYAAQKAWRFLGSPHIDNAARLCHSPSTAAMKRVLGVGASTCSYRDLYGTDLVVLVGSNPANDQPVMIKYLEEAKKLGTRVVVINTLREPGLQRYYVPSSASSALFGTEIADHFFDVAPGGDQALFYAVQQKLLEQGSFERDAIDRAFVDAHTEGFDDYARFVAGLDTARLRQCAGTTQERVDALATLLANAKSAIFIWSMGLTQHAHGTQTIEALCALALSRGFIGRAQTGLMPIRGHSGVQGGAEMGAYATAFPGGNAIDEAGADALAALWGFRPPAHRGMDTCSMLEAALARNLELLYAVGGNFLDTLPQPGDVQSALERIPVRVHQDIVLSRAMLVDPNEAVYLLPAKTRYEHVGGVTETTTERRVIYSPFVPGHEIGEAREEWRIALQLAQAAWPERASALDFVDADAVRADIAKTIPSYRGIEQLKQKGDQFQWGGERLCEGGIFPLPGGRARFVYSEPPDSRHARDRFHLGTRRGKQFNSMVQAEVDQLTGASRDHVLMNVEDMRELGLSQDAPIRVTSAHGIYDGRAFSAPMVRGAVQMHWPEANVLIASGPRDPGGLVPDYNAIVQIAPRVSHEP